MPWGGVSWSVTIFVTTLSHPAYPEGQLAAALDTVDTIALAVGIWTTAGPEPPDWQLPPSTSA